jgi:hypothetical protein
MTQPMLVAALFVVPEILVLMKENIKRKTMETWV